MAHSSGVRVTRERREGPAERAGSNGRQARHANRTTKGKASEWMHSYTSQMVRVEGSRVASVPHHVTECLLTLSGSLMKIWLIFRIFCDTSLGMREPVL